MRITVSVQNTQDIAGWSVHMGVGVGRSAWVVTAKPVHIAGDRLRSNVVLKVNSNFTEKAHRNGDPQQKP
jgi:hypothetical protein